MKHIFGKFATLIVAGVSLTATEIASEQTVKFTNSANEHQYFLTDVLSWHEAQAVAKLKGGHLVTINDAQENAWLVEKFVDPKVDFLWIGLNDVAFEGNFEWVSGQPVTYTNWADGEPNNNPDRGGENFGALNGTANPFGRYVGTWSDAPSQAKLRGIVEIPSNH